MHALNQDEIPSIIHWNIALSTPEFERKCMLRAIEISRMCKDERPDRASPKVGAVIVRDGKIIDEAYRGELNPGEHAEYTLLEKKLPDEVLADATLFTTLEPCTARNHPKIPSAARVIERRIAEVVIGILDYNPAIRGLGQNQLRDAGIRVRHFDSDLMPQIEELNRHFVRPHKQDTHLTTVDETPRLSQREKKLIDCAFCVGSGTIVSQFIRTPNRKTAIHAPCPICKGVGQLNTELWNQPRCRRCDGFGKLTSQEITRIGRKRSINTVTVECDVCGGTGRMRMSDDA